MKAKISEMKSNEQLNKENAPTNTNEYQRTPANTHSNPVLHTASNAADQTFEVVRKLTPEASTIQIRESADPLAHIVNSPAAADSLLAVVASSHVLVKGLAHLSAFKNRAVVFHVETGSDYNDIAAIRHSQYVMLQSFGLEDVQEVAIKAYEVSKATGQPVIHFYAPVEGEVSLIPGNEIVSKVEKVETDSEKQFEQPIIAPQYIGSSSAPSALIVFGSSTQLFIDNVKAHSQTGLVLVRQYRPWSVQAILNVLPKSVKTLGLAEQIKSRTTAWSPLVLDYVADIHASGIDRDSAPKPVAFHLGQVTEATVNHVFAAISSNLTSASPVQNLTVGSGVTPNETKEEVKAEALTLETAYTKILHELFKEVNIINASDKKDAGLTSPEYGYGAYLAYQEKRKELSERVRTAIRKNELGEELHKLLTMWAINREVDVTDIISKLEAKGAKDLLELKEYFENKSSWLIGSDAWSHDLGNSGVHHVVSSGENLNMLIIDSTPYDTAQSKLPSLRKKDIGLYAMGFGNVYVASTAVYASYTQVLQSLIEAAAFEGPSVVLAYLPYHSESDDPVSILKETKRAVDSGYWPLYRYDPSLEAKGQEPFQLESSRIRQDLQKFLDRENKLTMLSKKDPVLARNLAQGYGSGLRELQQRKAKDAYLQLLDGLSGAPITILFASDGGVAENVAKRLGRRAKGRGLKPLVMAMDDFPLEDLSSETNVVFITATAGQGEFPQNGRNFWEGLKGATDVDLTNTRVSVFALGDSLYWPRKADKHYYNKPGKDLHAKLVLFGAQDLAPLGLGDDQDADGWSTGYNEWEPAVWTALGVDGIGAIDEPPPITNEDIKAASNYLRGTIAEGLKDESTGAISAHDQQLTKFHGIYMQDDRDIRDERKAAGLEPAYSFMARVRLPGCRATPEQWLKIDELSDSRGNGTFKITTRATFQLHGVVKHDLKPAIRGMNAVLIDTVAACGDVNRNVVTAALPENAKVHDQVVKLGTDISEHLLPMTTAYYEIWLEGADESDKQNIGAPEIFDKREGGPKKKPKKIQVGESTLKDMEEIKDTEELYGELYLPRKFKINVAVPPYNDVDVYAHDIGLIAIVENDVIIGCNVLVGGGMGVTHNNTKTYPRTGSNLGFMPYDKIVDTCEKVMLVQRDFGDRTNRKHARLKYTVDDLGVDVFKGKVEEYLGYKFEDARDFEFKSNTDYFGWVKDERGLNHFTSFIENGRVEDTPELQFKTGLREIAKAMTGKAEFRLTGNQHVLISNITDEELPKIKDLLKKFKLDNINFSGLRLSSAACVAFPTCGLAMAESERYLPVLITKLEAALEEYGLRHDSIVMRMTGCPNGCARPWLAEVALVGKAYGAYNLMLGGGYQGQRLNKLYRSSLKEDEILDILKPLFKRWSLERNDGEHFGDFLIRVGVIKETTAGKNFWEGVEEE